MSFRQLACFFARVCPGQHSSRALAGLVLINHDSLGSHASGGKVHDLKMPRRWVRTKNHKPSPHDLHWRDDDWLLVDGRRVVCAHPRLWCRAGKGNADLQCLRTVADHYYRQGPESMRFPHSPTKELVFAQFDGT